jgi:hypothetical protein
MAVETSAGRRQRWGGRAWGSQEQRAAYARAALIGLGIAAGLAGLAVMADARIVTTGTILLFAREHWTFWAAGTFLAVFTGALVARVALRAQPDEVGLAPRLPGLSLPTVPLLPALATFGGVLLISVYHNAALIAIAPALLAPTLFAILVARYHLEDHAGRVRQAARAAHVLLTHGVAFLTLATVYINKVRSLLSATTVALIACLLLLQLADGERFPAERRLIYALVGGVALGEITWALNYWPLTGWTGGALLLIAFYLVAGLVLAQVRDGVRRRDLFEYGFISAAAFAIVALSLR